MRYEQINVLLRELNPSSILEIGTWNGGRAIEMMAAASGLVYFGFDLFAMATPEDDEVEYNVKPHMHAEQVRARLPFPNKLYQGYTRDTLPIFLNEYGEGKVDFAFIDGGHSVETIESDWDFIRKIVKPGGMVVFDDYYIGAPKETIEKVGANTLLDEIGGFKLLPDIDPVVSGFGVQLAYIERINGHYHKTS